MTMVRGRDGRFETAERAGMLQKLAWPLRWIFGARHGGYAIADVIGQPRRPDFYGIGVDKAAQGWLLAQLREHPAIGVPPMGALRYFCPRPKRPDFAHFSALRRLLVAPARMAEDPEHLERLAAELRLFYGGRDAYLRIFGQYADRQVVGELTPRYYTLDRGQIAQMRAIAPHAKIIVLLRDPVERAISAGKAVLAEPNDKPEYDEHRVHHAARQPEQLGLSHYSAALERFERAFPGRVFVGFVDDIAENPYRFLQDLCGFLGVEFEPTQFPQAWTPINAGVPIILPADMQLDLYKALQGEYGALERRFPERVAAWRARYTAL